MGGGRSTLFPFIGGSTLVVKLRGMGKGYPSFLYRREYTGCLAKGGRSTLVPFIGGSTLVYGLVGLH